MVTSATGKSATEDVLRQMESWLPFIRGCARKTLLAGVIGVLQWTKLYINSNLANLHDSGVLEQVIVFVPTFR